MIERIEVKTKSAAEKAVKAGKAIRIMGGAFTLSFTGLPVNIEVLPSADVEITLTDCGNLSSRAELWGSSRAVLWGSSSAVLCGSSRAVLWGSSRAVLWGSSRAELRESSRAVLCGSSRAVLCGSSRAVLWGSSSAVLRESSSAVLRESSRAELWGSSRAVLRESSSAVLWESSSAVLRESSRAELRESSRAVRPSAQLWGSSSAVLWGSSRAVLWGSSRAVLWGSSSAELRESSSAVLRESSSAALWGSSRAELRESSRAVLWGSSRAVLCGSSRAELRESSSAEAFGYSFLDVRTRGKVTAAPTVNVNLWNGATCEGGRQQIVRLTTARDWCEYYGARIEGDVAVVYKGVRADFISNHGGVYTPGTMPEDTAWNGKKGECAPGCGLNFSPTPRHTHEFEPSPAHYLECRVLLDEMVVHFDGRYPQKCTARRVCAPLIECDVDGNHIVPEAA